MAEYPLLDPVLLEVRRARPRWSEDDVSPDSVTATALLDRIIAESRTEDQPQEIDSSGLTGQLGLRRPSVRRRVVIVSAVGVAAVVATLVVATNLVGPAARLGTDRTLGSRVGAALTAATSQYVELARTTTSGGQTPTAQVLEQWTYGTEFRTEVLNASGALVFDQWYKTNCAPKGIEVSYTHDDWWSIPPGPSFAIFRGSVGDAYANSRTIGAQIQQWLASGQLSQKGTPTVNGERTLEISGTAPALTALQTCPISQPSGQRAVVQSAPITLTLWVDPTTFLPVKETASFPVTGTTVFSMTSMVSWLPPTAANIAELQGSIPSGFAKVAQAPNS